MGRVGAPLQTFQPAVVPLAWAMSLSARLCPLKPIVPRQLGVKGVSPPCRRRHFRRGTVGHTGRPPCGTGYEDCLTSHSWLCNPRGSGEGTYDTVSALGHGALQTSLDERASGGQEGVAPLHPPPGVPPGPRWKARWLPSLARALSESAHAAHPAWPQSSGSRPCRAG